MTNPDSPKKRGSKKPAAKKANPARKVVTKKPPTASALKPPEVVLPTKGGQTVVLNALGVEGLCALIEDGHSLRAIADSLGMEASTLTRWIGADPQRSVRVRESRIKSAEAFADKAESVLMAATNAVEVARARELAQHYRWVAKTRNPREFGDKVELAGEVKVTDLTDGQLDSRIANLASALGPKAIAALLGRADPGTEGVAASAA